MTPRRLGLAASVILAAWLLPGAATALADGGPHIVDVNSGVASLTADSCAGCHRAHTAQGAYLLRAPDPNALCLTCHNGMGATTDVVDGMQFVPTTWTGTPASDTVMGALRGGGFQYALIDAANPSRYKYSFSSTGFQAKVPVLAKTDHQLVTSTHLGQGTAWGNGPDGTAAAGVDVDLECVTCHNPHGNGQYRILNPIPGGEFSALAGWYVGPTGGVEIADVANPTNATRNYTVIMPAGGPYDFATDIAGTYAATAGDYWRRRLTWNVNVSGTDPMQTGWDGVSPTNAAANAGNPPDNSTGLMTAWCISCHTRYNGLVDGGGNSSSIVPQGDTHFNFRHLTMNYGCLQCHVSHGSNAVMDGLNSLNQPDPAGYVPAWTLNAGPISDPVTSGDSRLLKVGGRGTCQLCHDPTHIVTTGTYNGPLPIPGAP